MSAITATTATPAALPEKKSLTAADITTLTAAPALPAPLLRRPVPNVGAIHPTANLIPNRKNPISRISRIFLILIPNRIRQAVPILVQARDTNLPNPAGRLVQPRLSAEALVTITASPMTPVPE